MFVTDAVNGVVKEALIAACLTAVMILVFLGSWRSTLIIAVSIPLSILVSLLILDALGYTLNVMTLGGLSLAVGILVDDATVELENIHRNLGINNKPLTKAVLDGAQQIAVPAFVATLSICIVFVSVVFLTGPARFLFIPLALAVVFAMMTSYLLSRTLVPVMVHFLLVPEVALYREEAANEHKERRGREERRKRQDGPVEEQEELALRGERPGRRTAARITARPNRRARWRSVCRTATSKKPGTKKGEAKDRRDDLKRQDEKQDKGAHKDWVWRIHERFNHHFENGSAPVTRACSRGRSTTGG